MIDMSVIGWKLWGKSISRSIIQTDNRQTWSIKMIGDCELADVDGVRVGRDNNDQPKEFYLQHAKKRYTGYVQIAIIELRYWG